MKLQAIMSLSMALALPAALQAQVDEMEISHRIDPTGITLKVDGAFGHGNFAILISGDGTGTTELGEDYGSLDLGSPMVLIAGQADARGEYDVHFKLDPQALADAGLVVYLQAISLNDSEFGDEGDDGDHGEEADPSKGKVRISVRLDLDFAEEQRVKDGPEEPEDDDPNTSENEDRLGSEEKTESERVKS